MSDETIEQKFAETVAKRDAHWLAEVERVTAENDQLRAKNAHLRNIVKDDVHTETEIVKLCATVLGQEYVDGDSVCVPGPLECVAELVRRHNKELTGLWAQVAQLRGALTPFASEFSRWLAHAGRNSKARREWNEKMPDGFPISLRLPIGNYRAARTALSTPAPPVIEREKVMPLSASDIMECAVNGKPIPAMRALATYAEESNWTQLYEGKSAIALA